MSESPLDLKQLLTVYKSGGNLSGPQNKQLTRGMIQSPQLKSVIEKSLPRGLDADRFVSLALQGYSRTPELSSADYLSVQRAMLEGCMVGLEVGNPIRAHMIPRKAKGQVRALMIPDYRGIMHLATRGEDVIFCEAQPVYEGDEFTIEYGTEPKLTYIPNLDNMHTPEEMPKYVWCKVLYNAGQMQFAHINQKHIQQVRGTAATQNVWNKWMLQMSLKTGIKFFFKQVPLNIESPAIFRATQLDDGLAVGVNVPSDPEVEQRLEDSHPDRTDLEAEDQDDPYGTTEAEEEQQEKPKMRRARDVSVPLQRAEDLLAMISSPKDTRRVLAFAQEKWGAQIDPSQTGVNLRMLEALTPGQAAELEEMLKG